MRHPNKVPTSKRCVFIADITHELRTPVTIIIGWQKVDQVYPIEEKPKISAQIIQETLGMQRLIQDLLDLSKLESGFQAGYTNN